MSYLDSRLKNPEQVHKMVLSSIFAALRGNDHSAEGSASRKEWHFSQNLRATLDKNWYLGFTSFGGPSVHFKIVSEYLKIQQM